MGFDSPRQEFLAPMEVARMLGYRSKSSWKSWLEAHPNFPLPVQVSPKVLKYRRREVEAYLTLLPPSAVHWLPKKKPDRQNQKGPIVADS